jgi:hypothetical protein
MVRADPRLVTQGWIGNKPCLVTIDTRVYVTIARPEITTGRSKRQPSQCYMWQTVSSKALPILKEVFLILTLGWHPLKIWVFFTIITNKFILGLDNPRAYDASVDLRHQTLHLAEEGWGSSHPAWLWVMIK